MPSRTDERTRKALVRVLPPNLAAASHKVSSIRSPYSGLRLLDVDVDRLLV